MWPSYNGQTSFEVSFSPNSLRTKIEAGLDNVRKVAVFVTSAYDITGREKKINGLVKFTLPYMVCLIKWIHNLRTQISKTDADELWNYLIIAC